VIQAVRGRGVRREGDPLPFPSRRLPSCGCDRDCDCDCDCESGCGCGCGSFGWALGERSPLVEGLRRAAVVQTRSCHALVLNW